MSKDLIKNGVYVGPVIHIDDLDISGLGVRSLGNLRAVTGSFIADHNELSSTDNLELVSFSCSLSHNPLTSLSKLKVVGGFIDVRHTPLKSLSPVIHMRGNLHLDNTAIESLGSLVEIDSDLFFGENNNLLDYGDLTAARTVLWHEGDQYKSPNIMREDRGSLKLEDLREALRRFKEETDPKDIPLYLDSPDLVIRNNARYYLNNGKFFNG